MLSVVISSELAKAMDHGMVQKRSVKVSTFEPDLEVGKQCKKLALVLATASRTIELHFPMQVPY